MEKVHIHEKIQEHVQMLLDSKTKDDAELNLLKLNALLGISSSAICMELAAKGPWLFPSSEDRCKK